MTLILYTWVFIIVCLLVLLKILTRERHLGINRSNHPKSALIDDKSLPHVLARAQLNKQHKISDFMHHLKSEATKKKDR